MRFLAICALVMAMGVMIQSSAEARGTARGFARQLNSTGSFHHSNHNGEVIYRSSGRATRGQAMRTWMNSPGHRSLIQSGQINRVRCVGNVCVGR
jgi:uncharacterized protein YkwD